MTKTNECRNLVIPMYDSLDDVFERNSWLSTWYFHWTLTVYDLVAFLCWLINQVRAHYRSEHSVDHSAEHSCRTAQLGAVNQFPNIMPVIQPVATNSCISEIFHIFSRRRNFSVCEFYHVLAPPCREGYVLLKQSWRRRAKEIKSGNPNGSWNRRHQSSRRNTSL